MLKSTWCYSANATRSVLPASGQPIKSATIANLLTGSAVTSAIKLVLISMDSLPQIHYVFRVTHIAPNATYYQLIVVHAKHRGYMSHSFLTMFAIWPAHLAMPPQPSITLVNHVLIITALVALHKTMICALIVTLDRIGLITIAIQFAQMAFIKT